MKYFEKIFCLLVFTGGGLYVAAHLAVAQRAHGMNALYVCNGVLFIALACIAIHAVIRKS